MDAKERIEIKNISVSKTLNSFTADILDEDRCRKFILDALHPDGIFCPQCRMRLQDERTVKNFYTGKRCLCKECGKKFFPTHGTVLHKSSLSMSQAFALAVFIALGASNKQIAGIVGIHPDSVRIWKMRLGA